MAAMAKLLLNLRNVPDDEADEVRAWLTGRGIAFYETTPSPWGISAGGIWVEDDADFQRARGLMADYQAARRRRALDEQEAARREGRTETFTGSLRQRPLYVLLVLAAMVLVVLLTLALPWWLLR